jgi:hypothetical protein
VVDSPTVMGHDIPERQITLEAGVQVTLFSPSIRRGSKARPKQSRARPTGAAKRTLDGEDRFEIIEKGETARKLLATSVTKSASIGAIDRDPLQEIGGA